MATYLRATWANTSDARIVVQTVHRLDDGFVVLSHCAYGTSDDGFDAEWRHVVVLGVDEGKLSHCELFFADNDLDAAISRFEELIRPHQARTTPRAACMNAYRTASPSGTGQGWRS